MAIDEYPAIRRREPKRITMLLTLAILETSSMGGALAAPYPYAMSGDAYVQMLRPPTPRPYDELERDKAFSYLDGLKDATQGRLWCDIDHIKTPDLADTLAIEISRMPPPERKRSAALLLLELLQRKFPCKKATGGRP